MQLNAETPGGLMRQSSEDHKLPYAPQLCPPQSCRSNEGAAGLCPQGKINHGAEGRHNTQTVFKYPSKSGGHIINTANRRRSGHTARVPKIKLVKFKILKCNTFF